MPLLDNTHPTIPATDLDRSQAFYVDTLGLELMDRDDYGFRLRDGDWWARVFVSQTSGTAEHTVAGFGVQDVPAVVEALGRRGVSFEEYDTDQIKTEGGIATFGPVQIAWFRDPDGNLLAVSDGPETGAPRLADAYLHPTIPASDLGRAESFYTDVLRLPKPSPDSVGHGLIYTLEKSFFHLYASRGAGSSSNTAAGFTVEGIEELVAGLRENGVVIEEYDLPGLKTVDGVADLGIAKAAWIRDSEGNLIGLVQLGV